MAPPDTPHLMDAELVGEPPRPQPGPTVAPVTGAAPAPGNTALAAPGPTGPTLSIERLLSSSPPVHAGVPLPSRPTADPSAPPPHTLPDSHSLSPLRESGATGATPRKSNAVKDLRGPTGGPSGGATPGAALPAPNPRVPSTPGSAPAASSDARPPSSEETSLSPRHREHLEASSIDAEVIAERGYRTVSRKADLRRLGFGASQLLVPSLLVPIHGVTGEVVLHQIRPDEPRVLNGKKLKYETPKGARLCLDVPPRARPALGDPGRPLFMTEGSKKADSAVSRGLCCVALIGVWGWRGTNAEGGALVLPDLDYVALRDREVYVVFDSDVMTKREVYAALRRLAGVLDLRGAKVRFVYLPSGAGGAKVGLDDFFVAGHGVEDLLHLATTRILAPVAEAMRPAQDYAEEGGGIVYHHRTPQDVETVRLTNFTARVVAEVHRDDGLERSLHFEVEGRVAGEVRRFSVPATEFHSLDWVPGRMGIKAVVHPARGAERHVPAAIQMLSLDGVKQRTVFEHTGWREVGGAWVYLHGGGAIGARGVVEGVEVSLPPQLAPCLLPPPPTGEECRRAVRASLGLLELGPARVLVLLLCALWRSVVRAASLSLVYFGRSGTFKTALAALGQQHWGSGFDPEHLPGSWSSTANSQEGLAFVAKDMLLVIDDLSPAGTVQDIARQQAQAERMGRAQGNNTGRARCAADGSLRPPHPPRGLTLWTAETLPRGFSLRARTMLVEVREGDVDVERLTGAQRDAEGGLFASALSAYLRWHAGRRTEILRTWPERVAELRSTLARLGGHRRVATNVAELVLGFQLFLDFAREVEAIDEREHARLARLAREGCVEAGRAQGQRLGETDAVERFRDLLSSALTAGEAHVADRQGDPPPKDPRAWGWRRREVTNASGMASVEWVPQGDGVGWIDETGLYLVLGAAHRVAQRFAQASGEALPVDADTLKDRLHERGLLAHTDGDGHLEVKVRAQGKRVRALHLRGDFLDAGPDDEDPGAAGASGGPPPAAAPVSKVAEPESEEIYL